MVADAAGLGRITVFSALGQPLRAEVEVNAGKDELNGMVARIATPESFRQAGLEYAGAVATIKVALDKRATGQSVIKLTSDRPVSEPFLDVLLELNWPSGKLVREYTFLLDPPEAKSEAPASAAVPVAAPQAVAAPVEKAPEKAPEKVAEKPAEKPVEKPAEKAPEKVTERAAAAEKGGAQRLVKSGDTLAKIAGEVKPQGVALDQMLVGLFRANPDAFQGNMNRLKSGKILAIPSQEEIESVGAPEARKEVIAQAQDWNAYRSKLAGVAAKEPAAEKPAQKEATGKITAKVEEKAVAPVENKDQVKVSKTQAPGAQPPAAKKSAAEEEKIAREKALKESAERAAQLEKNVADLQKLAELKNKQLAQAQAAAKPAEPAAAAKPVEAPKPVVAPAAVSAPAAEPVKAAVSAVAAQPAVSAVLAEPVKPAASAPAAEPIKTKPKAPPPPPIEEEDEGMGLGLWAGIAALLGGIGGLVFYRRRKAAEGEVPVISPLGEPSLGANSVFRATGGQSIDTSAATPAVTDFSQTGPGTIDTDEVDPVAEAEVYMAYGRDAQAEEILLEALQKDGKRLAIHLKLLEIYAQRKSAKQFETLATELYAQTGGNGPEWEKAVAMGSKLDPANPLYGSGGTAPAAAFAAPAAAAAFDADATMVVSSAAGMTADAAAAGDALGVGLGAPVAAAAAAPSAMSFDLNLGDLPSFGEAAPVFDAGSTVIKAAPEATTSDAIALDFDLDLGGTTASPTAASSGMDFDLTLGDSKIEPHFDAAPANKPDLSSISLDLGSPVESGVVDFERTMLATPEMADALATNIMPGGTTMGEAQEQAVSTKLDLAKAYEEMGDAEGAKELLNEVIAEGTSAQKEAANAMLAKLG